tara:strand:- start:856 stop:1365 length:510 start_codon:yes stop_codon:yes gene_type:complete
MQTVNMTIQNIDKTREFVIEKFNKYFDIKCAIDLESALLMYTKEVAYIRHKLISWDDKRVRRIYLYKFRSLDFNFKTNESFRKRVRNMEVLPEDVVIMGHDEIMPERWEEIKKKKMLQETSKTINHEGMFKCEKCNSKCTTYYQLQIRSADEPMTTFIECVNCNNRWTE